MAFLFRNLEVYKKAVNLYEKISSLTENFPKGTYHITDQLNRAALSISLNIAEGNGRFHKSDRKQFFRIARGSTFECVPIVEVCFKKEYIKKEDFDYLFNELDVITKMLTKLADIK